MKKMSGKSLDLLEKNIDIIQKTFPEVMTEEEINGKIERKIDFDKLRLLLGDDVSDREERYELRWNGKNDAIRFAQTPSNGTLRPDKESSKNWDDTENLYIEGDNLEVLKLLQKSYFGKIDVIYIDPPYNTGSDFIYKDNFKDNIKNYKEQTGQDMIYNTESDGRYHTNWLNMMYPRLILAKNLLSEDGVILISIDENEFSNLKKICDEIFGESNYFGDLVWEATTQPNNSGIARFGLQKKTETILFYAKDKSKVKGFELEEIEGKLKYPHKGKMGACRFEIIEKSDSGSYSRPTMKFQILGKYPREGKRWQIGEETARKLEKEGKLEVVDGIVKKAVYPEDEMDKRQYKPFWSLLNSEIVGTAQNGKEELNNLMGTPIGFDTVKPIKLIKQILSYLKKDSLILDFFSGSATTAHAVMQLNTKDGGSRKFIMIQLPEMTKNDSDAKKNGYENICEIGKERIRRAGDMIVNENKDKEGIEDLDIGFKVFKLDSSNIKEWDPDYENLESSLFERQDIIKMGRTNEDLLYEIIIKMGIEPTVDIEEIKFGEKTIYNIGMGALLICLEDEITEDLVAEITNHKSIIDEMKTKVVFKESGFKTDSDKMNAIQKLKQFGITDVRSV